MAGQVCHQSGYTVVLKTRKKLPRFGEWLVGLKSLQDADAQAVDILIAYFNTCQRNMIWGKEVLF